MKQPQPATGRLAEIEDFFLKNRKTPNREKNRERIVSLLDFAKRNGATKEILQELEDLTFINNSLK
jgi:hypothetical protein